MQHRNHALRPLATAVALALATTAVAQQQAQSDQRLPEVRVQASPAAPGEPPPPYAGGQVGRGSRAGMLGDLDFLDAPYAVNSYTSQTIRDQQARSIADVVANDPSVRVGRAFGTFADHFVIRGFVVSNDDVAFGGLYGLLPRQIIAAELIERVEVFRGPNAFLNGMPPGGSIGGGINVVPKRADDVPLTRLIVGAQSTDQVGTHLDIGRRFGPDGMLGIRFNGSIRDGETAVRGENRDFGLGTLGVDLRGDRVRASLDAGRQKTDITSGPSFVRLQAATPVPAPRDAGRTHTQPWEFYNLDDDFAVVRGEFDVNPAIVLFGGTGVRHSHEVSLQASPVVTNAAGATTGTPTRIVSFWNRETSEAGARMRFATGPVKHSVSFAATDVRVENGFLFDVVGGAFASSLYNPVIAPAPNIAGLTEAAPKRGETLLRSFGVADTLSFADDTVLLTLGARRQQVIVDAFSATGALTTHYDQQAVTPSMGVVVKPWKGVSVYANTMEGLTQGPTAPNTAANAGQVFPPFRSKQKEIGVKLDRGRLGATVAVFEIRQPSSFTNPATNLFGLDGEQRNRGIELGAFGELARNWRLLGGVTLIDATQTKTLGGLNDGKDAIGVPDKTLNLGTEWDVPSMAGLTLSARVLHTGAQYLDAANTKSIPDWTRFDIGVRYVTRTAGKPLTLRANVENLFDRNYWSSATGGYLTLGAPRTVLLSASMDF